VSAVDKNEESISDLQQSKNIIQNELSNRMNDTTLLIAIVTLFIMIIIFFIDLAFRIPEKIKWWFITPRLNLHLKSYTPIRLKQKNLYYTLNDEGMEEYLLKVNNNPVLGFEVRLTGKYLKYKIVPFDT
jgi:hypothetical protein